MSNDIDKFGLKIIEEVKDFFIFIYEKPLHLILIGITLILFHFYCYKSIKMYLLGILFIVFASATLLETNHRKNKLNKRITSYYNELPDTEKEIIEHCLKNKTLSYAKDIYSLDDYTEAIYSLVQKGFGQNISYGGDFIMYNEVYSIIKSIKRNENK